MQEANETEQVFERKYGTRSEVWEGVAAFTRGKLSKADLVLSRSGRIVSKKKSDLSKQSYQKFGFKKREPQPEPQPEKKKVKRRRKKKVD